LHATIGMSNPARLARRVEDGPVDRASGSIAPGAGNRQETAMRFMIIVKATPESEQGVMPGEALIASMADYHEQLAKAGVLLDASGLQPSSKGWRVRYDGVQRRLVDGPFPETAELVAGYTIIQTRTREEALEWSRRFPNPSLDGGAAEVEVRQVFELDDFGESQAAGRFRDMGVLAGH
jgi:hypothetical protein